MKSSGNIEKILKKYKSLIVEKYKVKEIGVFGSYVRGDHKRKSDVDILVEFEEVPDLLTFIEMERYLENLLNKKVLFTAVAEVSVNLLFPQAH